MQNFIAQSMRRFGLAPKNKGPVDQASPTRSGGGEAPLQHMKVNGKWSYSTLQYPADIQSRTDLGHYMMFYINVADSQRSQYSTYDSMKPKAMGAQSAGDKRKGKVAILDSSFRFSAPLMKS